MAKKPQGGAQPVLPHGNGSSVERWQDVVDQALRSLGGTAHLQQLYQALERHPRTEGRKHWKAKVRQVLQRYDTFTRVGDGTWSLASKHSTDETSD